MATEGKQELSRKLGLEWSTFLFIILNIATVNFLMVGWIWRYANIFRGFERHNLYRILSIISLACAGWAIYLMYIGGSLVAERAGIDPRSGYVIIEQVANLFNAVDVLSILSMILGLGAWVLFIIISLMSKDDYEKLLAGDGTPLKLKGIFCFLFPYYYQYYVAYNAGAISMREQASAVIQPVQPASQPANPQNDIAAQLEQLAKMRDSGVISADEFETAKKKLLNLNSSSSVNLEKDIENKA